MAVSYIGGSSDNTTTTALPGAAAAGDLAVVITKAGTTTPPTMPGGWTNFGTGSGSASHSSRVAWKLLTSGDITAGNVGTWTNSQFTLVGVYRGALALGAGSGVHANSGTITFPARSGLGSGSWQVGLANHNTGNIKGSAVSNYTNRSSGFTSNGTGLWDSNGPTSGIAQQTLGTVLSGNSGWTVEVTAAPSTKRGRAWVLS